MESIPIRTRDLNGDITHVEWAKTMSVSEAIKMSEKICPWYTKMFPSDSLGEDISPDASFQDLYNALSDRKNVYSVIGVGDSVIRERCFERLSEITGIDYETIYYKWLRL